MKIVFAGTPSFAVAPLKKLIAEGFAIAAVLTQPDKPQGRKGILTPSPVKLAAQEAGIPVLQPENLKADFSDLAAVRADAMVTCAYGQILTQEVLDLFPLGVWNVHASLLPAYRGAAPIPRCIMDGCRETGVTVMKTELGLDTGDILLQRALAVEDTDTCGTLTEKLSLLGAELIAEGMKLVEAGKAQTTAQGEGFVCKKVAKAAADFSRPAAEVSAFIRALSPAPLAFGRAEGILLNFINAEIADVETDAPCGTILSDRPSDGLIVACGQGAVRVTEVQPAGGKKMRASDFLNGRKLKKGMRFEDKPVL